MTRLVLFDVDGTLVRVSSERMFWRYLMRRGKQGPRQLLAWALFLVRYLPAGGIHALRRNKAYLHALAVDQVEALAQAFVRDRLIATLFEPAVQRLRAHQQAGDTIVLLSGTLEPIARALAEHLNVRHVCATVCSQRHGRYLAQPPELHPYDAAKRSIAARLARELGLSLSEAMAYADSWRDIHLLEAVGTAIAVRPDHRLHEIAQRRAWEVLGSRRAAPIVADGTSVR
jgi:HAD superfamily hydrolase (TIGR01490 family)